MRNLGNILYQLSFLERFPAGKALIQALKNENKTLEDAYYSLGQIYGKYQKKKQKFFENSDTRRTLAFAQIWPSEEALEYAKSILKSNYNTAMSSYTEFSEYPLFRKALDKFFLNPKDSLFTVNFDPESGMVHARILAEEIVGTPEELGMAILAARQRLAEWTAANPSGKNAGSKSQGPLEDGQQATMIWYIKLWRTARKGGTYWAWRKKKGSDDKIKVEYPKLTAYYKKVYRQLMAFRVDEMSPKAPIWYLVENGNANIALSSNKPGGYGDPEWPPTHFVSRSEVSIQTYISTLYNQKYNEAMNDGTIDRYNNILEWCQQGMDKIDEIMNEEEETIRREEEEAKWAWEQYQRDVEEKRKQIRREADAWRESHAPIPEVRFEDFKDIGKEVDFVFDKLEKIGDFLQEDTTFQEKVKLKQRIIINKVLTGDVPASGQLYFVSASGKELRLSASKALQELEQDPEGREILNQMLKLDTATRKLMIEQDQVEYKAMLVKEQSRSRSKK